MISLPVRCIQCGRLIAPFRHDNVWRNGQLMPLHKGGCPRSER